MSIKKLSDWVKKTVNNDQMPEPLDLGPIPGVKNQLPPKPLPAHTQPQHRGQGAHQNTRYAKKFQPHNRPPQNRLTQVRPTAPGSKDHALGQPDDDKPLHGPKMRLIPLGGLEEVGKNIMVVEYGDDIILIDCGMSFAGPEMMGVDYIVPDVTYLEDKKHRVRGIIFTHGHLDHIGAVQYVIPRLANPPLYGTKLTCGLIKNRVREFGLDKTIKLHEFTEDSVLKFGQITVEFFRVNHSIPEGMGVYISTPGGTVVHSGDFKFDYSPAIDKPADLQKIASFGKRGVDVLLIDSTNGLRPGFCKSESEIAKTLEDIIRDTKGRLIIAAFSSLIGRVSQIIAFAEKYNRKVFVSGRSMSDNIELATELGYIKAGKGVLRKISPLANSMPPSQVIILTTGAQGESMSALTRMAIGEHASVKIQQGDTVVISASPIPGNEMAVVNVINNLYRLGAKVITHGQMDVHTSGHAHQEELKLMYTLLKPKVYVPVHGELYMRIGHGDMIKKIADPDMHLYILENGDVLEVTKSGVRKSKQKVPANDILVDGLGFGEIGSKVIMERTTMSQDGVLIMLLQAYEKTKNLVKEPDIISRGFLYIKESEEIAHEVKQVAAKSFTQVTTNNPNADMKAIKQELSIHIGSFIRKRIGREPLIIPIIQYV